MRTELFMYFFVLRIISGPIVHLFGSYAHVNRCPFLLVSGVGCEVCSWLFLDISVYLFPKLLLVLFFYLQFEFAQCDEKNCST